MANFQKPLMEVQITGATVWLEFMVDLELLELPFAAFTVKYFMIKDPSLCYQNLSLNIEIDFQQRMLVLVCNFRR